MTNTNTNLVTSTNLVTDTDLVTITGLVTNAGLIASAETAISDPASTELALSESPWAIRPAARRRGRAALEVYERGELLDVVVETKLGAGLVRGARREIRHGSWASIAWGRLPRDGVPPLVAFVGRLGRRRKSVCVTSVAGAFWFACAEGSFHNVLVQPSDGPAERLRTQRAARSAR